MEIGKMKISECEKHLKSIATLYKLRLNRVKEFKLAKNILVNLYCQEVINEYINDESL
jgi:hypothetical protein